MEAMLSSRHKELEIIPGGNTEQKVKVVESKLSSSTGDDGAKPDKGKFIIDVNLFIQLNFLLFLLYS